VSLGVKERRGGRGAVLPLIEAAMMKAKVRLRMEMKVRVQKAPRMLPCRTQ